MAKLIAPPPLVRLASPQPSPAVVIEPRANLVNSAMANFAPTFQARRDIAAWQIKLTDAIAATALSSPMRSMSLAQQTSAKCERATAIVGALPGASELESAHKAVKAAATGATDERETCALLCIMLDGMPSAKNLASEGYIDALMFAIVNGAVDDRDECGFQIDLEMFSPTVIAAAVRLVWHQNTFTPSIAEFFALARKAKKLFRQAADEAEQLVRQIQEARSVLVAYGKLPPDDDDIPL